ATWTCPCSPSPACPRWTSTWPGSPPWRTTSKRVRKDVPDLFASSGGRGTLRGSRLDRKCDLRGPTATGIVNPAPTIARPDPAGRPLRLAADRGDRSASPGRRAHAGAAPHRRPPERQGLAAGAREQRVHSVVPFRRR